MPKLIWSQNLILIYQRHHLCFCAPKSQMCLCLLTDFCIFENKLFDICWPPHVKSWLIEKNKTWCWEGLGAGGEGDDRGWDGCMASPTWWTWVWVSSRSWWWTGRPGMLRIMGTQSQTQLGDWTELNWTD